MLSTYVGRHEWDALAVWIERIVVLRQNLTSVLQNKYFYLERFYLFPYVIKADLLIPHF